MEHEAEIKELLIGNAIHLIAEGGFEKATTKNLTYYSGNLPDFKMNEAYIYRLFGSKEKLYEAAFLRLDHELFRVVKREREAVGDLVCGGVHEQLYRFFTKVWQFILGSEDRCRCYVRYYYSVYFKDSSAEAHKRLYAEIIDEARPLFKEEADVPAILHSVFVMLFDFGIRVYNGELEDDDVNRPHVFNVLYCMMQTYFRHSTALI